ncbi:bacteriophage gp78 domain protein [Mycobacterium xenopi 3993]|nr:bacteriophage gp78 domain protein [Mycobacterium xenopi 3993]
MSRRATERNPFWTGRDNAAVQDALSRKCGMCGANVGEDCNSIIDGGPLPGRIVHHYRVGRHRLVVQRGRGLDLAVEAAFGGRIEPDPTQGGERLMPRIRTIKPEFWDSPDTAAADLRTRLLYIAMWNWADDYGIGDATRFG